MQYRAWSSAVWGMDQCSMGYGPVQYGYGLVQYGVWTSAAWSMDQCSMGYGPVEYGPVQHGLMEPSRRHDLSAEEASRCVGYNYGQTRDRPSGPGFMFPLVLSGLY